MTEATNLARPLARGAGARGTSGEMGPVVATLVLEGGRVGDELGGMALLELGSALAAVTSSDAESHAGASTPATDGADEAASRLEPGRLGRAPHWIDDTPPRAAVTTRLLYRLASSLLAFGPAAWRPLQRAMAGRYWWTASGCIVGAVLAVATAALLHPDPARSELWLFNAWGWTSGVHATQWIVGPCAV